MQLFPRETIILVSKQSATTVREKLRAMLEVPIADPTHLLPIGPKPKLRGKVHEHGPVKIYYHRPWKKPFFRPEFKGTIQDAQTGSRLEGEFFSRPFDRMMLFLFIPVVLIMAVFIILDDRSRENQSFFFFFLFGMLGMGLLSPRIGWFNGRYDRAVMIHALEMAVQHSPASEAS